MSVGREYKHINIIDTNTGVIIILWVILTSESESSFDNEISMTDIVCLDSGLMGLGYDLT
jgi:hypothetical protein